MTLRSVFMGSPDFAVPCLHAAHRTTDVRLVVTQPDRPAGRGRKPRPPAAKAAAQELGLEVAQPTKMRDGTLAARLRQVEPDVVVVVAFGRILPPDILGIPPLGCINVHASILPRWRGAAPIQRAVLAGDTQTGVAIMRMDEGLDTGPVYRTVRTPIGPFETSGELFERLAPLGGEALGEFLASLPGVPEPIPQSTKGVTHAPPLDKSEGQVGWGWTVERVVNHVRGMDPWPGAFTTRGRDRLKLFGARPAPDVGGAGAVPGTVLGVSEAGLAVACLDGVVGIAQVQPAGRKRMPAAAYLAGRPLADGEILGPAD